MLTRAEAQATAEDISGAGHVSMAQAQASRKGFCSVRHGVAFLLHFCNFSVYAQQVCLTITIPAMVHDNHTAPDGLPNASSATPPTDTPRSPNDTPAALPALAPTYDWSPESQGIILSAVSYGALLACLPSGYVAGIVGVKYLLGAGMLISSVLNFCIPVAADTGVALLVALRAVQGAAQAVVLVSQYSVWVKWAPPLEKNQLIAIMTSGSLLGFVIVYFAGGVLLQTQGWPSVFYVFGGVSCASTCLWFPLFSDDPVDHPFISAHERNYIVCSLAQQERTSDWSVPLKAMLCSLPLWGILVSHLTVYWYLQIILVYLPTYLSSVLHLSSTDSGFLLALLSAVCCICVILGGLLADCLLSRKILRLVTIRKLFTAVGVLLFSVLSVFLSWVTSSLSTTMVLLGLCFVASSLCQVGVLVNFVDIAPRYSSFLRGLLVVFAQISGAIAPTVSGVLLSQDSEFGWRNTFLLSGAINILGLIFYLIVGQAEVQEWAKEPTSTHF